MHYENRTRGTQKKSLEPQITDKLGKDTGNFYCNWQLF